MVACPPRWLAIVIIAASVLTSRAAGHLTLVSGGVPHGIEGGEIRHTAAVTARTAVETHFIQTAAFHFPVRGQRG